MMTSYAVPAPMARRQGVSEISRNLAQLLNDRRTVAQWWVDLVGQLDELSSRLVQDSQDVWRGISDQITRDAPHMTSHLRRLDSEQERLQQDLLRVRIIAGESAGDPRRARSVRAAVRDVLHRLRRHEERTTQVLYDAYSRDLGGECA